jgi:hypothetical protein
MTSLLELPVRAVVLATAPARFAARTLLSFVRDDAGEAPRPAPVQQEAPAPQRERKGPVAREPRPKPAPKPPSRTQVAREQRVTRPPQPEGGPGPEIHMDEPWEGYEAMTEDEVLERLVGADPTVRAVVRLYESTHGSRRQVLLATEETVPQP